MRGQLGMDAPYAIQSMSLQVGTAIPGVSEKELGLCVGGNDDRKAANDDNHFIFISSTIYSVLPLISHVIFTIAAM